MKVTNYGAQPVLSPTPVQPQADALTPSDPSSTSDWHANITGNAHPLMQKPQQVLLDTSLLQKAQLNEQGEVIAYSELNSPEQVEQFMAVFNQLSTHHQEKLRFIAVDESFLTMTQSLDTAHVEMLVDSAFELSEQQRVQYQTDYGVVSDYLHDLSTLSEEKRITILEINAQLIDKGAQETWARWQDGRYSLASKAGYSADEPRRQKPGSYNAHEGYLHHQRLGGQMVTQLGKAAQTLSADELKLLQERIATSDYATTRGMVDMAALIEDNQRESLMSLLTQQAEDTQAVFALFGEQSDLYQFTEFYSHDERSDNELYYFYTAKVDSEVSRTSLLNSMLSFYNQHGAKQLNQAADLLRQQPAQERTALWLEWDKERSNNKASMLDDLADKLEEGKTRTAERQAAQLEQIRDNFEPYFSTFSTNQFRVFHHSEIETPKKHQLTSPEALQALIERRGYPSRYQQAVAEHTSDNLPAK
ncbi:hypothetical protein L1285_04560 [Pseudoalteromonas sp. DL2-H2.2]|uniref:hypothetical protein n=1 Tax=Pseudoalteromonas sp. DL2-H2.2 TaxID=2908889 RepID=UPI001F34E7ED|nr:hypothetical protein [Pseudoalteromonas sp. DL2-H2.2]MCF2907590.1 hypothetical protein [Pseudoalteromonas sp. DL2-H2.2]